ncbi:hypothetical protein FH972_023417 [Carpinus fangiana]|uniref:Uncharacterized protein n=1 Tax=Carpinus fangiana TaxID=176857 RepID=A0A5N6KXE9_9ROSI|nr:hypothetical protein FH972_023417 [Carpinus fangiana]
MLNPLNVSELLTSNVYLDLYSKILCAYAPPFLPDIVSLRDQAAVVAMLWQQNSQHLSDTTPKAITVQDRRFNTVARALKDDSILVLTGRASSNNPDGFTVTVESHGDQPFHGTTSTNHAEEPANPLEMQRKKVETIVKTLENGLLLANGP